mmetsp:Transcript_151320/g.263772  ORF Transcript_151320/g.263772 Transcript_151320/m.263772 type:complete len:181 (-) Transcript_151320:146-688(-)
MRTIAFVVASLACTCHADLRFQEGNDLNALATLLLAQKPSSAFTGSGARFPMSKPAARAAVAPVMAEMANGKMTFGNVKREWRCKWEDDGTGKASSPALVEIADLVDEFLPKIKELEGVVINRNVCGGCLDFKLGITVPLDTFGPWETAGHPPEAEFLEKLGKIKGVTGVETQTMTEATL